MSAVRRIPLAGWLCALVAVANGAAWSLIVPPLQVPDEPAHLAYVQYLAETGEPPSGARGLMARSDEQNLMMRRTRYKQVEFRPENRPLTTRRAHRRLEDSLDAEVSRESEGGYTRAAANPPLYYALQSLIYRASPSDALLDRLALMRLFSALLAGVTVLCVFMFLRETLPAAPWAWTVGALAVALLPLLGNVAGGVNSDNLLYSAAAATFLALAACFRRGLTPGRGVAIGLIAAAGMLAKLTFWGLLPGVALALALLVWRAAPENRRRALVGAGAAVACLAVPLLAYVALSTGIWDRGGGGATAGGGYVSSSASEGVTITGALSYVWQFYLPALPGMDPVFEGYPLAEIWFDGLGLFGPLDFEFGTAVDAGVLVALVAVAALAGRELYEQRASLRARRWELLTYAALALGLLVVVHGAGYTARLDNADGFEQTRYLFPLLALYGAAFALAARAAGRRLGPAVGVILVSLACAHALLGLALALTRYYG